MVLVGLALYRIMMRIQFHTLLVFFERLRLKAFGKHSHQKQRPMTLLLMLTLSSLGPSLLKIVDHGRMDDVLEGEYMVYGLAAQPM